MNSTELCNNTFLNSLPSLHTSKSLEIDDIALLLDNVPELDSMFFIKKKIGYGTFSSVYLGQLKSKNNCNGKNYYAVKHIIPTSHPSRIFMELKCLKLMGGKNNIIEATVCFRNLNHIVLVMPYFSHDVFNDYVGNLSIEEIRDYIYNLLKALEKVHSYNIIHRDIKPSNFLYSRKHRKYALIDFGLAQDVITDNKSQSSVKNGLEKRYSCPLTDTPQMTLSRPVKRKLAIPFNSSPDIPSGFKKSRITAPKVNISPNNAVFSITSTRINSNNICTPVSPSKFSPSSRNSHKENTPVTSVEPQDVEIIVLNDSPSKHTRLAEAFRSGKNNTSNQDSFKDCITPCEKISLNNFSVRKSPRKSNLNRVKFLKGINDSITSSGSYTARSSFENSFAASTSGYSVSGTHNSDHPDNRRKSSAGEEANARRGRSILCPTSCRCYGNARVCSVCLGRKNQHAPRAGTPGFRAPEVLLRHPYQTTAVDIWSAGVIVLCLASGRYPFFRPVDDISSLSEITTIFGTRTMKKIAANLGKLFTSSDDTPALDLRKICRKLRSATHRAAMDPETGKNQKDENDLCKGCKSVQSDCLCLAIPIKNFFRSESNMVLGFEQNTNVHHVQSGLDLCDSSNNSEENSSKRKDVSSFPPSLFDLLHKLLDPNHESRITAKNAILHPFFNEK